MMIELRNVSKGFGQTKVLEHLSLSLRKGFYHLQGPSGRGKTVLLHLLAGLLQPDEGEISGLQGLKTSYVFQDDRLVPFLSARDNLTLLSSVDTPLAESLLEEVGLGQDLSKLPGEMSGGMRKRVAIARAAAFDGDLFLLDEPFNGLDGQTKEKVMGFLRPRLMGKIVLLATHQGQEAQALFGEGYTSVSLD